MIRSEDIQEEGRNLTAGAGTNFEYMGEGIWWDLGLSTGPITVTVVIRG